MLVSEEITDATYQPGGEFDPQRALRTQALLLVVEGELERQVAECLKLSESERGLLDEVFGRPVAWNPQRGGGGVEDVSTLLSSRLDAPRYLGKGQTNHTESNMDLVDHVECFFERCARAVVPHRGLPDRCLNRYVAGVILIPLMWSVS